MSGPDPFEGSGLEPAGPSPSPVLHVAMGNGSYVRDSMKPWVSGASADARPGTVEEHLTALAAEVRQRNIDLQCIPRTVPASALAGLMICLATPEASFITGQTIACGDGYTHSF